ncbi:MAG: hypothetical protein COB39_09655 [Marinosulfonomonas sp.]|nr:MAG: hypothetical protein COB39_09655 [Marinosulfonomonas sp.]
MRTDINIVYHLGAPHTDNELITWSLRKDAALLAENGVMIRRPKEYRPLLSGMIAELKGDQPSIVDQEALLGSIIKNQEVDRLIMSNSKFLGVPSWMFYGGTFYRNAANNTARIRDLFPDNPCEFFLGISNPANFIPAVFTAQTEKKYEQFIDKTELATVRWSDVISSIQKENPECPITVWCNEDTPIIWPTILREIAGLDPQTRLQGELDVIRKIMSQDGIDLLVKYLDERPDLSEIQRRRIRGIFLEKFFLDEAVEEEIDLPGWTEDTVDALTEIYDDDIERIDHLPGVNFISL